MGTYLNSNPKIGTEGIPLFPNYIIIQIFHQNNNETKYFFYFETFIYYFRFIICFNHFAKQIILGEVIY